MGRKNQNNRNEQNNSVPPSIFFSSKISRGISGVLICLINLVALYYGIMNWNSFTREVLTDTINIGFTVVLAIVALAITVFQTDKELLEKRNSDENVKKVYLSYVFSIFPTISVLILGYLVAYAFENYPHIEELRTTILWGNVCFIFCICRNFIFKTNDIACIIRNAPLQLLPDQGRRIFRRMSLIQLFIVFVLDIQRKITAVQDSVPGSLLHQ